MKTIATIFSGLGGVEAGAVDAGFTPLWAIEKDAELAECHFSNFATPTHRVITRDASDTDTILPVLDAPDCLWASPPCQAWSPARNGNLPERDDAEVGMCIPEYIDVLRPRIFIMENVTQFRLSNSFYMTVWKLSDLRYFYWHGFLDAADFGVPQTRKRLFLIALRNGLIPHWHAQSRVGWWDAIRDIWETLPVGDFQKWQADYIPEGDALVNSSGFNVKARGELTVRRPDEPSFTICANHARRGVRARVNGVIRKLDKHAYARLQSFPDWFVFPEQSQLSIKGIGNAVPPLMAQRLLEALT